MNPEVTILLPIHGACPDVLHTLQSIDSQTFRNFEILVVDDRASSHILAKIQEFSNHAKNVRVVKARGVGLVAALNTGIAESQAPFIARIDADDYMVRERIQIQFEFLAANPQIAVVGSQMILINPQGNIIGKTNYPIKSKSIAKTLFLQNCIGHPSVMFRKKVISSVGGYQATFQGAEDYELWTRVVLANHQIHNLSIALTFYRISDSQYSKNLGLRGFELSELIRLKYSYPVQFASITSPSNDTQEEVNLDLSRSITSLELEILKSNQPKILSFQKTLTRLLVSASRDQKFVGVGTFVQLMKLFIYSPSNFSRLAFYAARIKTAKFF